jgi:hypothetical protein
MNRFFHWSMGIRYICSQAEPLIHSYGAMGVTRYTYSYRAEGVIKQTYKHKGQKDVLTKFVSKFVSRHKVRPYTVSAWERNNAVTLWTNVIIDRGLFYW